MPQLSRPGVVTPEGTQFFNSPAEAAVALARALQKFNPPAPQAATIEGTIPLVDVNTGEPLKAPAVPAFLAKVASGAQAGQPATQPTADLQPAQRATPYIVQPRFQDTLLDESGNVRPHQPSDTKLGALVRVLRSAAQGGMDALAGGALDVVPGRSAFGAGLQAAQAMPLMRVARAQAIQRQQLQNQMEQAQIAALPLVRRKQEMELANMQSEMDYRKAHSDYWRSAAGARDITDLNHLHASLVAKAIQEGRNPDDDIQVQQVRDAITSTQRPAQPHQETPFSVWRLQNPNAPVREYFKLSPEAHAEFATRGTHGSPQPRRGTPTQFNAAGIRMRNRLSDLEQHFRWNPGTNLFEEVNGSRQYTPAEWNQQKQAIQNDYENEITTLGGAPAHVSYDQQAQAKPSKAQATATARNSQGKMAYLIGGRWYTEDELQ